MEVTLNCTEGQVAQTVPYYSTAGDLLGYEIECINNGTEQCESWILLPGENLWNDGVRGFIYLVAMLWTFIGIAIASDIFMGSIEVITAKKRKIVKVDPITNESTEYEILIWNETVANLTLMALGSSAPEILIALIEAIGKLPGDLATAEKYRTEGNLGVFTIMGSASYNLLIISAICIVAPQLPAVKKVSQFSVFLLTSGWSIWAYVWMLLVVKVISPGVIEIWEAVVTLIFFPLLALTSYMQDNHCWIHKCRRKVESTEENGRTESHMNVKIIRRDHHDQHGLHLHGVSKEIGVIQNEMAVKRSQQNLRDIEEGSQETINQSTSLSVCSGMNRKGSVTRITVQDLETVNIRRRQSFISRIHGINGSMNGSISSLQRSVRDLHHSQSAAFARARFRHAVVKTMTGGQTRVKTPSKDKLLQVVDMTRLATHGNPVNEADSVIDSGSVHSLTSYEDMCGKFTFAAPEYSVHEDAGSLNVDVLFHRKRPSKSKVKLANGTSHNNNTMSPVSNGTTETTLSSGDEDVVTGAVSVKWETREGSAKPRKDFKYSSGKLEFQPDEYRKTIQIPIIDDHQWDPTAEFYILLHTPEGDSGLGYPSIAKVSIIDDDKPGVFSFARKQNFPAGGRCILNIKREKGSDGVVSIHVQTLDKSAVGGMSLEDADYITKDEVLEFKHHEASKNVVIDCAESKDSKYFVVKLSDPTGGATLGDGCNAVVNLNTEDDGLGDALEDIVGEEDEPITWKEQFANALTITADEDEEGGELRWYDYVMHFISLPWKLFCAIIPPTHYLGGMLSFIWSIIWLGLMSMIVEQLASLLGCVIGLKTAASGISIVALGTSVPDTFASRTAAKQDEHADAAIGNITGSNSVNVFLGLGLPWVILSIWYRAKLGIDYQVQSDNLTQAVIMFVIVGCICLIMLLIRRFTVGGELGGKKVVAYLSAAILTFLWLFFLAIVILIVYKIIDWELP